MCEVGDGIKNFCPVTLNEEQFVPFWYLPSMDVSMESPHCSPGHYQGSWRVIAFRLQLSPCDIHFSTTLWSNSTNMRKNRERKGEGERNVVLDFWGWKMRGGGGGGGKRKGPFKVLGSVYPVVAKKGNCV